MLLGQLKDHRAQRKHTDQVGDGHEAVEGIGDVPSQAQVHGSADDDDQGVDDLIGLDGLAAQDELPAAGAIQAPAEDGGQGEQAQADGDDQSAELGAEHGAERLGIEGRGALGAVVEGSLVQSQQDGQTGQGADDDGVHEDLEDAVEALLNGVGLGGSRMRHGGGTETGLVGKHAALDAPGDAQLHADTGGAAGDGLGGESALEDHAEDVGNLGDVENNNQQAGHDIDSSHHRHQLLGDGADALDAADEDNAHNDHQDDGQNDIDGHSVVPDR